MNLRLAEYRPPKNPASTTSETLWQGGALDAGAAHRLPAMVAAKIEALANYDVVGMTRLAAILSWGRSGSLLLASYFDGHDDVIMLPELCGWRLYEFFDHNRPLPLKEKLLGYPSFDATYISFFEGNFAISPEQYYAAVQAIDEVYGRWPAEFLTSRRAFFVFVHLAYHLAQGRRPGSSRPLIVHAQHAWGTAEASYLVEDFPETRFIHTIRDPISSCDRMFHFLLEGLSGHLPRTYIRAPYSAFDCLIGTDRPQTGMDSRTWTVRFEDLHRDTATTMRDLSEWLDLPFQASLVESTFNGIPYVVTRNGVSWSGRRVEQTERRSPNLSRKDRALIFAILYENFVNWNYPHPAIFASWTLRCVAFVSLVLLPTKMEVIAARRLFQARILPSLRRGNLVNVIRCLLGLGLCRMKIIGRLTPAFCQRCFRRVPLLEIQHSDSGVLNR